MGYEDNIWMDILMDILMDIYYLQTGRRYMGDILANMRRMTILWNIVMQYFTLRYNKGMRWNLNG